MISISIGTFLKKTSEKPDTYLIKVDIKPGKQSSYVYFAHLGKNLESDINAGTVFSKFNEEFLDYEELIVALKKDAYVRDQLSKTPEINHQNILYKFVKLFSYEPTLNENVNNDELNSYTLKVNWHDSEQGRKIIDDAVNLTLINLRTSIFNDLNVILKMKKDALILQDLVRINYLQEQSEIAKELSIVDNQVDFVNMSQSGVSFSINSNNVAYYLRGFKAIDKEINLIKNRSYTDLTKIENSLKSLEVLNTKWIDYNKFLASVETINDSNRKNYLIIFLVLGLVIGILYAFISKALQSQKSGI